MGQRFTTDDVAAVERLDYWREAICDVFVQLECRSASRRGFYGHVTSEPLERVHLSEVSADAQHVVRGKRQLARASEDDFLLSVQLEGVGLVRQDERDAPLEAGSMALYASTRPYELIFPRRFRQLVLQLPRTALSGAIANPDALTARTIGPATLEARLLRSALVELNAGAASLTDASRAHVARSVVQSLAAALSTHPQATLVCEDGTRDATRTRILAFIDANLADPNLGPAMVAQGLGFSRQHVHRMFAGRDESFERYVWRLRLERARADLVDPALRALTIGTIATRHGFVSPEHFQPLVSGAIRIDGVGLSARDRLTVLPQAGRRVVIDVRFRAGRRIEEHFARR